MLSPVPVEQFGGLDLRSDPGEAGWKGAVDLLNVEFDQPGRLRSRDGYAELVTSNLAGGPRSIIGTYFTTGSKRVITQTLGGASARIYAFDETGTAGTSLLIANMVSAVFARFAAPGAEHVYYAASSTTGSSVGRYEPASPGPEQFTTPVWTGTTPNGKFLATQHPDNRLVNARRYGTAAGDNPSTVRFSDAGVPTTWTANNYVDISPGDGEAISAIAQWRDLLFVFKETKFAVFYGNSTDSSGNPVFNYRMVVGACPAGTGPGGITVAPNGVYFVTRRGIYHTTGEQPTLISPALDPLFRGAFNPFFQGAAMDLSGIALAQLCWFDERLFFSYYESGVNKTMVYNPATSIWTLWDIPIATMCSWRVADQEELIFGLRTTTRLYRYKTTAGYTQDGGNGTSTGAAITSRYRSGFDNLGSPDKKRIHSWRLEGSGSPTLQLSQDFGALETGAAVTLGTSPAIASNFRRYAPVGRQFSFQIGGTTAWSLNSITANLAGKRDTGLDAA